MQALQWRCWRPSACLPRKGTLRKPWEGTTRPWRWFVASYCRPCSSSTSRCSFYAPKSTLQCLQSVGSSLAHSLALTRSLSGSSHCALNAFRIPFHSFSHSPILNITLIIALALTLLTLTLTRSWSHSQSCLSHTHSLTHSLTLSHASLSYTVTRSLTHTLSYTLSRTLSRTL